jgi:hypothetical protein
MSHDIYIRNCVHSMVRNVINTKLNRNKLYRLRRLQQQSPKSIKKVIIKLETYLKKHPNYYLQEDLKRVIKQLYSRISH